MKHFKHFKWIAGAVLLICMMTFSVPVFATGIGVTPWTVAYELLGNSNNLTVPDASSPMFIAGSTLTTEMYLGLTLSGPAAFNGSTIYSVCANNSGGTGFQLIGSSLPYSATNLTIPLTSSGNLASVLANNQFFVTSDAACNGNVGPATQNMQYIVPALSAVGNATMGATMYLGGGSLHAYSSANVIQVVNQISTALSSTDLIQIDYINSPANGTYLVPVFGSTNLIAMSPSKITVSNQAYNSSIPPGSLNLVATLYDTQSWSGITSAYLAFNGDCVSGNITGSVNTATSLVNGLLTLATNSAYALPLSGASSNGITVCVAVTGNSTLPSRTITGSYVYFPSSRQFDAIRTSVANGQFVKDGVYFGGNYRAPYNSAGANAAWQTWTPNGYQAFCPYVYAGGGAAASSNTTFVNDTFVRFVNASAANATVFAQIYNGTTPNPTPYTLGVIAPYSSGTYWGGDLAVIAGVPYGTTFAAQYTVTAPPLQVSGCAYYKRVNSNGSNDRSVPLLTDVFAQVIEENRPR